MVKSEANRVKYVPSIVVVSVLLLIFASWPAVDAWSELTANNHFLVHCLFLIAGGLFGLQTSRWVTSTTNMPAVDEGGVSS